MALCKYLVWNGFGMYSKVMMARQRSACMRDEFQTIDKHISDKL